VFAVVADVALDTPFSIGLLPSHPSLTRGEGTVVRECQEDVVLLTTEDRVPVEDRVLWLPGLVLAEELLRPSGRLPRVIVDTVAVLLTSIAAAPEFCDGRL